MSTIQSLKNGAKNAIERLIRAFKAVDSIGSGAYARFLTTGAMTAEEIAAVLLRARGAVNEFAAATGNGREAGMQAVRVRAKQTASARYQG